MCPRVPAAANYMEDGPLQSGEYGGAILAFVLHRMHFYENSAVWVTAYKFCDNANWVLGLHHLVNNV